MLIKPSAFQSKMLKLYREKLKQDFLCCAAPGSGKTYAALMCGIQDIEKGVSDYIIFVSHRVTIMRQAIQSAANVELDLDNLSTNGLGVKFPRTQFPHGAVASNAWLSWQDCDTLSVLDEYAKRATVIQDEVHHLGGNNSWPASFEVAFKNAPSRIFLTGTPLREDGSKIIGCEYSDSGEIIADVFYGMREALEDGVVAPVDPQEITAVDITWERKKDNKWLSFSKETLEGLSDAEITDALATLLHAQGSWVNHILQKGVTKLDYLRDTGYNAGGLIIAKDIKHANQICDLLKRLDGRAPVLVTHENKKSAELIKDFSKSKDKWLVSVKMVSEGVDIPRLRVLLYMTNVTTEVFFHQALGRVNRIDRQWDGSQRGYMYFPAIPKLTSFADSYLEMCKPYLKEDKELDARNAGEGNGRSFTGFLPGDSTPQDGSIYDGDGNSIAPEWREMIEKVQNSVEEFKHLDEHAISKLIKSGVISPESIPGWGAKDGEDVESKFDEHTRLRKIANDRLRKITIMQFRNPAPVDYKQIAYQFVKGKFRKALKDLTCEQLESVIEAIDQRIKYL